jgi:hypothetical protein
MPCSDLDLALFEYDLANLQIAMAERGMVRLVIVHRYAELPGGCTPGEEIQLVCLVSAGLSYPVRLSTPHLILFDYLSRHRNIPQTAAQIATGLNTELFYVHHGSNARGHRAVRSRTSRTAVRKQVERIRKALAESLADAHLALDPTDILRSEPTSSNERRYSVHANVVWEHDRVRLQ